MWYYKCEAGQYMENTLCRLLTVIIKHRFQHLIKGEGFKD